jgi:hypothetical protein
VIVAVETGGKAVSQPMEHSRTATVKPVMEALIDPSARIVTDEGNAYVEATGNFAGGHERVNHNAGQYVNDFGFTTNGAESFFSLLKRGHYGTYHKMSKQHLHRYCTEFDFRWNGRLMTDAQRRDAAVVEAVGRRLFCRQPEVSK